MTQTKLLSSGRRAAGRAAAIFSICLLPHLCAAQQFVPSTSVGGSNPDDIINDPATGNVGIGDFYSYPNPKDKLTVGGNISLHIKDEKADRQLLGRTDAGSLSIYSNNDVKDGPGIRLFSRYHDIDYGAIHLIATGGDYGQPNGIGHLMSTYTDKGIRNRLLITQDGRTGIGEHVDMGTLFSDDRLTVNNTICLTSNADADTRILRARTNTGRLDLYTGADLAGGPAMQLYGTGFSNSLQGGSIRFVSKNNFQDGRSFEFMINDGNVNNLRTVMTIDRQGRARVGAGGASSERLMVDGDIYLYDPSDGFRDVRARSYSGGLNIRSGSNGADGSGVTLFAANHGINPGQLLFTARGAAGKAFDFQTYNPNTASAATRMSLDHNGDVHYSGKLLFDLIPNATPRNIQARTTNSFLCLAANTDSDPGSMIQLFGNAHSYYHGAICFASTGAANAFPASGIGATTDIAFEFANSNNGWDPLVKIYKNGKMRIGKDDMNMKGSYKLYVEGGIMTEVVNVAIKNSAAWADYVFDDGYKLMPLQDVAKYVADNKHLPEVPAADEVAKNGVNVAEMNALLLKKVEELTLYVIDQQKVIRAQGKELEQIKAMLPGK